MATAADPVRAKRVYPRARHDQLCARLSRCRLTAGCLPGAIMPPGTRPAASWLAEQGEADYQCKAVRGRRSVWPGRRDMRRESSVIRPALESDAAAIADLYNHYIENTVTTFEEEPVTAADMWLRIRQVQSELKLPWIVLEDDSTLLGYACAVRWKQRSAYRFSCESTIYLHHRATGMGLGVRLYGELLQQLRALGLHSALGGIALPNDASVALHEKLGFHKVAHLAEVGRKFDRWIDVGYWQLSLQG